MMSVLKSIAVAFSIYSKIPMPRFRWESEDMKYHLIFFPWVGGVIGALCWLWLYAGNCLELGEITILAIFGAIPLLVTGGFHVDGFMDTMDAIHSYQEKEKKLEILKDPHIGAFSVICLLTYVLVGVGAFSMIESKTGLLFVCIAFFLARTLSGISVVTMKSAKGKGMLSTFSSTAEKRKVLVFLLLELAVCVGFMFYLNWIYALSTVMIAACSYLYYGWMSKKQFGGITGDLAGFFVTITELLIVIGIAVTEGLVF